MGNANLLTKVYFPRVIIPGAAVAAGLVDLFIAFGVLIVLMIYYHVAITWTYHRVAALSPYNFAGPGWGMWTSALNVKYRDIRYALPFVIQLWMFVSPVIFPSSFVPEKWRWALALNPLTGIIEGFRSALFGRKPFDWIAIGISTAITFAILLYAAYTFRRMERTFADII